MLLIIAISGGGLVEWVQSYENAFAELAQLGVTEWQSDASKKRKLIMNAQNTGINSTILYELTLHKSFSEVCKILRSHAIRETHFNKYNNIRRAQQSNAVSDVDIPTDIEEPTVQKIATIPTDIWASLPKDIQKAIIDARRAELAQNKSQSAQKPQNGLPSQYGGGTGSDQANRGAKVNNTQVVPSTEEEEDQQASQQDQEETYAFLNQFLLQEDEANEEQQYNCVNMTRVQDSSINLSTFYVNTKLYNQCFNMFMTPESTFLSILDSGADTSVIGKGWLVIATQPHRKANVVGFDKEHAFKNNLDIVTAVTAIDLPDKRTILVQIHEAVYNPSAKHSLLSEYQLRENGIQLDTVPRRHKGSQSIQLGENKVELGIKACMVHFQHRLPTKDEMKLVESEPSALVSLTQGEVPWKPQEYSDDPCETFLAEVDEVDAQSINVGNVADTPHVQSAWFYDPTDSNIWTPGEAVCLNLETEGVHKTTTPILKEPQLHKVIPSKLDFTKMAPYFGYRPKNVIQKTIEKTTQLAKAIIHMPLRRHFKSRFHMLRRKRRNEVVATDTYYASVSSICGATCAQVFYGCTSRKLRVFGMSTESEFPAAYKDFLREEGIPHTLRRDNAKAEQSSDVEDINRTYVIADSYT